MKTISTIILTVLVLAVTLSGCSYQAPAEDNLFVSENQISQLTSDGVLYTLQEFKDLFMTEHGNYCGDSLYRYRSTTDHSYMLFSIDTLPTQGSGIYIRGRITTDDFAGNFYKVLCIQQMVGNTQQALRISVDAGSIGGMYQLGQEILIRCNGLAIGKYANQPQLCVPSYNNNVYANKYEEKVGWAPGRIPLARFQAATTLIGLPDPNKLVYDTVFNVTEYTNVTDIFQTRNMDARLVCLKGMHYTGQYLNYSQPTNCTTGNPAKDGGANVFAPTTNNMNYPQSRVVADDRGNLFLVSTSEYAKYANFYLPGADSRGISNCKYYGGDIVGIVGFYADQASKLTNKRGDWTFWSVSLRSLDDLQLWQMDAQGQWVLDENGNKIPWPQLEYMN